MPGTFGKALLSLVPWAQFEQGCFYWVTQGAKESRALSVVPGIFADVNALKFAGVNEICKKLVN